MTAVFVAQARGFKALVIRYQCYKDFFVPQIMTFRNKLECLPLTSFSLKCSSLVRKFVNYGLKKYYNIGPRQKISPSNYFLGGKKDLFNLTIFRRRSSFSGSGHKKTGTVEKTRTFTPLALVSQPASQPRACVIKPFVATITSLAL
jgi:hypothetical protein